MPPKGFKKNLQKEVIEFLASHWNKKRIFASEEIREALGLTPPQLTQVKEQLCKKKITIDYGRGLIGLKKTPSTRSLLCSLLTEKDGDPYCPAKHTFIERRNLGYFCGQIQGVRFNDGEPEIYYRAHCDIHKGIENGEKEKQILQE